MTDVDRQLGTQTITTISVRMPLIRLDDNRVARLQQYPLGYIATGVVCWAAKLRDSLIVIEYFLKEALVSTLSSAVAIGCSLRSLSAAEQAYDNARYMRLIAYILLLCIQLDGWLPSSIGDVNAYHRRDWQLRCVPVKKEGNRGVEFCVGLVHLCW
jgi:hypothetical protein